MIATHDKIPDWFDQVVAEDDDAFFAEDFAYAVWIENGGTDDDFVKLQSLMQTLNMSVEDVAVEPKQKPIETIHDLDGLLTAKQAAVRLNITVEQLGKFVEDGAIRYINTGRGKKRPRYRFDPTDLDAFKVSRSTLESPSCPSSSRKRVSRTIGTASKSNVVGFTALHAARMRKTPRGTKR
jgi:excisionase family DNA binding protein